MGRLGQGAAGARWEEDGAERFGGPDGKSRDLVGSPVRSAGGGWGRSAESRWFGSLPIAGHLWRGSPVGSGVVRGQGIQGPLTLGLLEGFQLPGQHVTATDPQEGGQASAQALGGLHPGSGVEVLAHGVSGEVVLGGEGPVKGGQLPRCSPPPRRPRGSHSVPCQLTGTSGSGQGSPGGHVAHRGFLSRCTSPSGLPGEETRLLGGGGALTGSTVGRVDTSLSDLAGVAQ